MRRAGKSEGKGDGRGRLERGRERRGKGGCELIIQMDPPTTVTALVQIRGRARKQGSRY